MYFVFKEMWGKKSKYIKSSLKKLHHPPLITGTQVDVVCCLNFSIFA